MRACQSQEYFVDLLVFVLSLTIFFHKFTRLHFLHASTKRIRIKIESATDGKTKSKHLTQLSASAPCAEGGRTTTE